MDVLAGSAGSENNILFGGRKGAIVLDIRIKGFSIQR
jgi:hypothetical protein